eukprot:Hpha_TRINITY_DN19636_c0_g1::TRINITY_DN19636_c0_g1_i1::g.186281::m.186281
MGDEGEPGSVEGTAVPISRHSSSAGISGADPGLVRQGSQHSAAAAAESELHRSLRKASAGSQQLGQSIRSTRSASLAQQPLRTERTPSQASLPPKSPPQMDLGATQGGDPSGTMSGEIDAALLTRNFSAASHAAAAMAAEPGTDLPEIAVLAETEIRHNDPEMAPPILHVDHADDTVESLRERLHASERKCAALEARCGSLERLMSERGAAHETQVRRLQEELQKRTKRVKELEQGSPQTRARSGTTTSSKPPEVDGTMKEKKRLLEVEGELKRMRRNTMTLEKSLTDARQKAASLQEEAKKVAAGQFLAAPGLDSQGNLFPFNVSNDSMAGQMQQRRRSSFNFGFAGPFEKSIAIPSSTPPLERPVSSPERDRLLLDARNCISTLQGRLAEKDAELEAARCKLDEAHNAIMTNVDGIAQLDGKLQQSRKALRWMLKQQASGANSRDASPLSRSVSPVAGSPLPAGYGRMVGDEALLARLRGRSPHPADRAGTRSGSGLPMPSWDAPAYSASAYARPADLPQAGVWAAPPSYARAAAHAGVRSRSADTGLSIDQVTALRDLDGLMRRTPL